MEQRSNESSSFSCQSLYDIGTHGPESFQQGSLRDAGKLSSTLSSAETKNLREPIAFRRPTRSSIDFHVEENGKPSPSHKTTRATEETTFHDSSRGARQGKLGTSSSTTHIGATGRVNYPYVGGVTEDSQKSTIPGANAVLAPETIGGDGDDVASIEDLTDSGDAAVMSMLAEFTEMARCTAVQNEELKSELTEERRRVAHTNRKLDQCNSTCAELRESLALAQDTLVRLREHEMKWAESTTSEMSLRAEVCALKDERATALGDATALKKRCEALQQENNELGERFAAVAEEKRQVETRARRLLRSDRYRSF